MTAWVIRAFRHEHNRLAVARQEYDAACSDYRHAVRKYDGHDARKVAALNAAADRRSRAWSVWRARA